MKLWRGLCQAMDFAALEKGKQMGKKYIDVDAAKLYLRRWITECLIDGDNESADRLRECIDILDSLPAADVELVRYGKWIRPHWKNSNYCCDCSECGREAMHRDYQWDKNGIYPICPNCGAKMDEEETNELD